MEHAGGVDDVVDATGRFVRLREGRAHVVGALDMSVGLGSAEREDVGTEPARHRDDVGADPIAATEHHEGVTAQVKTIVTAA